MDAHKLQVQINDQLDTIAAQVAALRAERVTNRPAAVALLVSNMETLAAWEGQRGQVTDTSSSASRQHFIDTGRYLTVAEVAEFQS